MTRDRIERAATENQFMNGKIDAIEVSAVVAIELAVADDEQGG